MSGITPLFLAALRGDNGLVRELLAHNAEIKTCEDSVILLLQCANCINRKTDTDALFKAHNNNVLPNTIPGFSPLHAAVLLGHFDTTRSLINGGFSLQQKALGMTPLVIAQAMNHIEIARLLMRHEMSEIKTKDDARLSAISKMNKTIDEEKDFKKTERVFNAFKKLDSFSQKILNIPINFKNKEDIDHIKQHIQLSYQEFLSTKENEPQQVITHLLNEIQTIIEKQSQPGAKMNFFHDTGTSKQIQAILDEEKIPSNSPSYIISSVTKKIE